jgi:hypothetical protein
MIGIFQSGGFSDIYNRLVLSLRVLERNQPPVVGTKNDPKNALVALITDDGWLSRRHVPLDESSVFVGGDEVLAIVASGQSGQRGGMPGCRGALLPGGRVEFPYHTFAVIDHRERTCRLG